jgi:hypothetical protein
MLKFVVLVYAMFVSLTFAVETVEVTNPCTNDITHVCGMAFPETYQAIYDARFCLRGSSADIKKECLDYVTNVSPSIIESCYTEIKSFCRNVVPGDNRMHNCLSKYPAELSKECSAAKDLSVSSASKASSEDSKNALASFPAQWTRPVSSFELAGYVSRIYS